MLHRLIRPVIALTASFLLNPAWAGGRHARQRHVEPSGCSARFDTETLPTLGVTPDMWSVASEAESKLLSRLEHLFERLDETKLTRIAHAIVGIIDLDEVDQIRENPFFRDYPAAVRPCSSINYALLQDLLSDDFDPYDIGLITALIPEYPRAKSTKFLTSDLVTIDHIRNQRIEQIVATPELRTALVELLRSLIADEPMLLTIRGMAVDLNGTSSSRYFTDEFLQSLLNRLEQGQVGRRDRWVIKVIENVLTNELLEWAVRTTPDAPKPIVRRFNAGIKLRTYPRDFALAHIERFLTERIRMMSSMAYVTLIYNALSYVDPLPVPAWHLQKAMLGNAEVMRSPIRLRARPAAPAPTDVDVPVREVAPLELHLVDRYAPRPDRPLRIPSTPKVVETARAKWVEPEIPADRRLRDFTSYVESPRAITELQPGHDYHFWYIREEHAPLRTVRFGKDVVTWMRANPRYARPMLSALHLGNASGEQPGIKALRTISSRRYDGPVFEIRSHGKFRALLIDVDHVWQVVKISEKGDIVYDVQWVTPL